MNNNDHNYEAALKQAKDSAGYSNLSRCYIALVRKLEELQRPKEKKTQRTESGGPQ